MSLPQESLVCLCGMSFNFEALLRRDSLYKDKKSKLNYRNKMKSIKISKHYYQPMVAWPLSFVFLPVMFLDVCVGCMVFWSCGGIVLWYLYPTSS